MAQAEIAPVQHALHKCALKLYPGENVYYWKCKCKDKL